MLGINSVRGLKSLGTWTCANRKLGLIPCWIRRFSLASISRYKLAWMTWAKVRREIRETQHDNVCSHCVLRFEATQCFVNGKQPIRGMIVDQVGTGKFNTLPAAAVFLATFSSSIVDQNPPLNFYRGEFSAEAQIT